MINSDDSPAFAQQKGCFNVCLTAICCRECVDASRSRDWRSALRQGIAHNGRGDIRDPWQLAQLADAISLKD